MRTTVNLDEELLHEARELTGITERSTLVREGLRALIQREAAHRLAKLGGSDPQASVAPRRRSARSDFTTRCCVCSIHRPPMRGNTRRITPAPTRVICR